MRRKDREITDRTEIESILTKAAVCRIGLADGGEPYIVPLCFGYENGAVYLHSAPEPSEKLHGSRASSPEGSDGKKMAMIRKNPRCCFEVDICDKLIRSEKACSWGMRYRSVIGVGVVEILTDPAEKKAGLNCIMQHYGGGTHDFSERDLASVAVIRVTIESITGKKHD